MSEHGWQDELDRLRQRLELLEQESFEFGGLLATLRIQKNREVLEKGEGFYALWTEVDSVANRHLERLAALDVITHHPRSPDR